MGRRVSGNGTVTYTVAPNTSRPKKRNTKLIIAGKQFTVTQLK